jgi:hypothetical protein
MSGGRAIGDWITCVPIGVKSGEVLPPDAAGLLVVMAGGTIVGFTGVGKVTVGEGATSGFRAVRVAGVGRGVGASGTEALGDGAASTRAVGGGCGASAGGLLSLPQWKMRVDIVRASPPCPGGPEPTIVITSPEVIA